MSDNINQLPEEGSAYLKPSAPPIKEEQRSDVDYWKERCLAAESVISIMDIPKNKSRAENDQFESFQNRYGNWQKLLKSNK